MDNRIALSVLDVAPILSGFDASTTIANTRDLARHCERLGYRRYWFAEHHNLAMIASSAPEVLIADVAGATETIRVGAGGMMLPNHSPLHVAEQFGLLASMHPGRIDLGIGRATGTDAHTALALRPGHGDFEAELSRLLHFLRDDHPDDHPDARIRAVPRAPEPAELWLLGSSDHSAELAGRLGLGFAYAHHIGLNRGLTSLRAHRAAGDRSAHDVPSCGLLAVSVVIGSDDRDAERLAASVDHAWLTMALARVGPLLSPEEVLRMDRTDDERQMIALNRERHIVGGPETVRRRLQDLIDRSGADELMVLSLIHDHRLRRRAYELLADLPLAAAPDSSHAALPTDDLGAHSRLSSALPCTAGGGQTRR
ncbi:MAG TPA: LLM class flavin-dependent oxidoreductase [Miltoncostaeaceae bacterium]|nr:LLM class flavin-dependent oxidoreductase [Miltoncostaeaceae bacterium]